MKVLQINCVYKKGSTGKLTQELHEGMKRIGIDSIVCYGRGARIQENVVYKTCWEWYAKLNNLWSRVTGIMYGGCFFSTHKLISIIKKEKPDIVHLQCINGYFVNIYKLLDWLKKQNIKTIITLHAEFMYTGSCGHAFDCNQWINGCVKCEKYHTVSHSFIFDHSHLAYLKMKNAFSNFKYLTVVSVSPWLKSRAEKSSILKEVRHEVILNGLNTEIFSIDNGKTIEQVKQYTDQKIILHVTADISDPNKGGRFVIELARRMSDILFLIIGSNHADLDWPKNIINIGRIDDQYVLACYYSLANLTIVTSKRETFSMVCAESLACGTPVVGFKAGAPEQISIAEYSEFCEYGDLDSLHKMALKWLNKPVDPREIEKKAKSEYSNENMLQAYLSLYQNVLSR